MTGGKLQRKRSVANWLLVIDEDGSRRAEYAARVRTLVAPIAGLRVQSREGAGWSAVWAAASTAPVDVEVGSNGGALLWGEARDAAGGLQTAAAIRAAWRGGAVAQWDGYYAAAVVEEPVQTLTVGTDVLGVFPIYYWTDSSGVVLVGTSPELFRTHPRFRPALNETGLVGILLSNGLVDGQTLWRGVRRLGPGCRLRVLDGRVWEDEGYRLPLSTAAVDLPLEGHVCQLAQVVEAAVKRHAPPGRSYGLLLSGGLDSRMIAGFLAKQNAKVVSLTFGRYDDVEMRCAGAVASVLGFAHRATEVPPEAYPDAAKRLARWEALAAGFGGVPEWAMHRAIASLADRVLTGHMLDGIVGGLHVGWAYDPRAGKMGFDQLLGSVIRWGFAPTTLKSMLIPGASDVVDDVMARLRHEYAHPAEREHHRAWIFDLRHRMRFHVGSATWTTSFASWPVLPFLDRAVLCVAAAMPGSSLADRRAQTELLVTRFPKLAEQPLDRNSHDMRPLRPKLRHEVRHAVRERCRRLALRIPGILRRRERLYYRRLFDMNSPGWRAVRTLAEQYRTQIPSILSREIVDAHLPPPEKDISADGPIGATSGMKMLLGLALWNGHRDAD
jgi:asparagine synthase (glutamine-hydrolysing)